MKHFHVLTVNQYIHSCWMCMQNLRRAKWDDRIIFFSFPFPNPCLLWHKTFHSHQCQDRKEWESNLHECGTPGHLSPHHLCCHPPVWIRVISSCPTVNTPFPGLLATSLISSTIHSPRKSQSKHTNITTHRLSLPVTLWIKPNFLTTTSPLASSALFLFSHCAQATLNLLFVSEFC